MVGRNIRATKSNQFIIGGAGATEVKFRGETGYNYAHDVSAVLTAADDAKVWTYDHATASIKMKTVSAYADLVQFTGTNGTETSYDKVVILSNPVTRTLASATGTNTVGKKITYRNMSTGTATIVPSGTELIDGVNASISIPSLSAITLEITGSGTTHIVSDYKQEDFDYYGIATPADNTTFSTDFKYKGSVYQRIDTPANLTLTHTNGKIGAIHTYALNPTGATSTITFQLGRFVQGNALVATKTIDTYTVITVRMVSATTAEIIDIYEPLRVEQIFTKSYSTTIPTNTEININVPVAGMTIATGKVYMSWSGTKPFGLIINSPQVQNGSVIVTIANYTLGSVSPALDFKFTVTSL
jgi:hypothetical protein